MTKGVNFQPAKGGQFSTGVDKLNECSSTKLNSTSSKASLQRV